MIATCTSLVSTRSRLDAEKGKLFGQNSETFPGFFKKFVDINVYMQTYYHIHIHVFYNFPKAFIIDDYTSKRMNLKSSSESMPGFLQVNSLENFRVKSYGGIFLPSLVR